MKKVHRKILDYIIRYIEEHQYSPTVREIAEGTGYASASTLFNHMMDMKKAGLIHYVDSSPRTITVPGYQYVKVAERRGTDGGKQRAGRKDGMV